MYPSFAKLISQIYVTMIRNFFDIAQWVFRVLASAIFTHVWTCREIQMHPQVDIRCTLRAVIRENAESTVVGTYTGISLNRCNSITSVNEMDGSFSAKCQWFVDLVTTHVCRDQKGTKRIKQFKYKVTSVLIYIYFVTIQIKSVFWNAINFVGAFLNNINKIYIKYYSFFLFFIMTLKNFYSWKEIETCKVLTKKKIKFWISRCMFKILWLLRNSSQISFRRHMLRICGSK